jgi:translation initiation factor 1 (eIF-1/SUI1)
VASYTTEFLNNEGWESLSRTDLPNAVYIRADKSRGRKIAVLISDLEDTSDDPGTLIAVVIDP